MMLTITHTIWCAEEGFWKPHCRTGDQETAAVYGSLRFPASFNTAVYFRPIAPNCNDARNVYIVTAECTVDLGTHDVSGRPATSSVHYTTSCNTQSSAPEDGQNNCPKHVEITGIIIKRYCCIWLVVCIIYDARRSIYQIMKYICWFYIYIYIYIYIEKAFSGE